MVTISISLSEEMKSLIEEQVASGAYGNQSEFVRDLIRQYMRRQAKERIERELIAGLDSGEPIPATPEFWETLRTRAERGKPSPRNGRDTSKSKPRR